jgi:hypothetical protein
MLTSVTGSKYWSIGMTLEEFMRSNAVGTFTLMVYGVAPGYLKVRACPGGDVSASIEYWLVGNVLLEEPPERPRPPEEKLAALLAVSAEAIAA